MTSSAFQRLVFSSKVVGGVLFDPKKIKGSPAPAWYVHSYLQAVLETLLGPSFRFTAAEGEHLLELRWEYTLQPVSILKFHMQAVEALLRETLRVDRLARLEEHAALVEATRAAAAASGGDVGMAAPPQPEGYDTLRMLRELAGFGEDGSSVSAANQLFGPLQDVSSGNVPAVVVYMAQSARDRYGCQVRWALVDAVQKMIAKSGRAPHGINVAGAAFLEEVEQCLEAALEATEAELKPAGAAHWKALLKAAKPRDDEKNGGGGGGLGFLFGSGSAGRHRCSGGCARL